MNRWSWMFAYEESISTKIDIDPSPVVGMVSANESSGGAFGCMDGFGSWNTHGSDGHAVDVGATTTMRMSWMGICSRRLARFDAVTREMLSAVVPRCLAHM